jgi:hypothetical protein
MYVVRSMKLQAVRRDMGNENVFQVNGINMTWKKKMKSLLLQASQVPLPVCILTTEIL